MNFLNFFSGIVTVEVKTAYMERLLNLCKDNIDLIKITRRDLDLIELKMSYTDFLRLSKIIDKNKYLYKITEKKGAPFILWRIKTRYGLFLGLILCVLVFYNVNTRIFAINIDGTYKTAKILDILEENDVKIGTKIQEIDSRAIPKKITLEHNEIMWISLNVIGNTLNVEVKERGAPADIIDLSAPSDIIADKAGIIDSISVKSGQKNIDVGQTFHTGDVLVSAKMANYEYILEPEEIFSHSLADITARVWYNIERVLSNSFYQKNYTGRESFDISIIFGDKYYNLFENSGNDYMFYDKIIDTKEFHLSKYVVFPVKLEISTYKEYERQEIVLNEDESEEILIKNTRKYLVSHIDGAVTDYKSNFTHLNGVISLTYEAETLEKVGIIKKR